MLLLYSTHFEDVAVTKFVRVLRVLYLHKTINFSFILFLKRNRLQKTCKPFSKTDLVAKASIQKLGNTRL